MLVVLSPFFAIFIKSSKFQILRGLVNGIKTLRLMIPHFGKIFLRKRRQSKGKTQPNQKLEERVSALIQQNSGTISHMRSKMPAQLALPEMQ